MLKTIFYFLLTNLAVLILLTGVYALLVQFVDIEGFFAQYGVGIEYAYLIVFALIFGMGGAFISLALSKYTAKLITGAQVISSPADPWQMWLLNTIKRLSDQVQIKMPEVAIYPSPDPNAFATGPSKNNALVAVSTGLLEKMTQEEIEAVLGHEIAHIKNGDMLTLTLIQGVLNALIIFLARVIGGLLDRIIFKNEEGRGLGYFVMVIISEIILGILASIVVFYFSRKREFRADKDSAFLVGREKMIAALKKLKDFVDQKHLPERLAAFAISNKTRKGLAYLFSTHPPLEERIEALKRSV